MFQQCFALADGLLNRVHQGLRMLVDGREPQAIRKILEVEIGSREKLDLAAA